ncbi:MAG: hypothetical protein HYT83_02120 [Candidatus Levybacteria bacterium]|nr:hypothetical protein [Candidatus Levybacteria bacterium]
MKHPFFTQKAVHIAILILILLVVGAAVWLTNRSSSKILKFTSDDGKVVLTIPKVSLPQGMSTSDISVKRVAQDDDNVLVYELAPSGLTVSQPIIVEITLEAGDSIPIISHFSGNDLVTPKNVKVVVDTKGKTKIFTEINHFSSLVVTFGFFKIDITGPLEPVDFADSFLVHAAIENTGKLVTFVLDPETKTTDNISTSNVKGRFIVDQTSEVVGPVLVEDRPALTTLKSFNSVSTQETFFCRKEGSALINLDARLRGEWTAIFRHAADEKRDFAHTEPFDQKVLVGREVKCSGEERAGKTVNKSPVIERVDYTQLHGSYEELPHRYLLKPVASDPEGSKLTYFWKINCGYFVGSTVGGGDVEWRYNTPGECVDAIVTVTARDEDGNLTKKVQSIF